MPSSSHDLSARAAPPDQRRSRSLRAPLHRATAWASLGLTLAFAAILVLDLRLYGALPDPALLPIQILLVTITLLAASPWRWAPAVVALVAAGVGVGSAVQPITLQRLTEPDHLGTAIGTVLLLAFATVTAACGLAETVRMLRAGRARRRG